jgi:hypothetical protein
MSLANVWVIIAKSQNLLISFFVPQYENNTIPAIATNDKNSENPINPSKE